MLEQILLVLAGVVIAVLGSVGLKRLRRKKPPPAPILVPPPAPEKTANEVENEIAKDEAVAIMDAAERHGVDSDPVAKALALARRTREGLSDGE